VTTTLAAGAPHAWLANGELGILAFGSLAVRTRERRPDQAAVDRAFIVDRHGRGGLFLCRRGFSGGSHDVEGLRQLC
jgi:hypothetical protein